MFTPRRPLSTPCSDLVHILRVAQIPSDSAHYILPSNLFHCYRLLIQFSVDTSFIRALHLFLLLQLYRFWGFSLCTYFPSHFHTNFMLIRPGARGGHKESQTQGCQHAGVSERRLLVGLQPRLPSKIKTRHIHTHKQVRKWVGKSESSQQQLKDSKNNKKHVNNKNAAKHIYIYTYVCRYIFVCIYILMRPLCYLLLVLAATAYAST